MKTGIYLLAFGKRGYYFAAFNLAFSIKHYGCKHDIVLLTDSAEMAAKQLGYRMDVFTSVIVMDKADTPKGNPAISKLSMDKYFIHENALYIDVDTLCLKDLTPLIDEYEKEKKPYISHTVGYHTIDKGRDFPEMQWAWADDIWAQYKLKQEDVLPAINSSIQFINTKKGAKIFALARKLIANPITKLRSQWGGSQPDELYTNTALAILGIDPAPKENIPAMYFAQSKTLNITQVKEEFYLLSYYGYRGFTVSYYTQAIDDILTKMFREKGLNHIYPMSFILDDKHANNR